MKNIINKLFWVVFVLSAVAMVGCNDDIPEPVKELNFDRLMTPTGMTARVTNSVDVSFSWDELNHTDGYILEIWADSMVFETLIDKHTLLQEDLPFKVKLGGSSKYTARVKGYSDKEINDSKWNSVFFKTLAESALNVTANAIKGDEATIKWPAGSEVTRLVIKQGSTMVHDLTLTGAEVAAATLIVTGLTEETAYSAELYNGAVLRGSTTFTTLMDLGPAIIVNDDIELLNAIASAANGDIISLKYNAAGYPIGTTMVTKSITLINDPDNIQVAVVSGNFLLNGVNNFTLQNLEFKGVAIDGISENYSSLIEFDATATSDVNGVITIEGCTIHDYKNAILYDKSKGYLYNSLNINNVLVYDIPGSGGDGIDIRTSFFANINITNSTFNNSFRSFLRYDKVTTGTRANISIENNTFNNVCGAGGTKGLLYVRTLDVVVTLKSNIVANIPDTNVDFVLVVKEVVSNGGSITFSKNYYYECNAPKMWANTTEAEATTGGGIVTADPFTDSAMGDFTLTDDVLKADGIGDPRWIK